MNQKKKKKKIVRQGSGIQLELRYTKFDSTKHKNKIKWPQTIITINYKNLRWAFKGINITNTLKKRRKDDSEIGFFCFLIYKQW